jgi:predicted HD phosphohydrolase
VRPWSGAGEAFGRDGRVLLAGALPAPTVADLSTWVEEVAGWASGGRPAVGLHHFEDVGGVAAIARSERFADEHAALAAFLRGTLARIVEAVAGEPVTLFKEKVNHKHPGGGGFAAHQDAAAYRFGARHVTAMVPIDPATVHSGCLWFARGRFDAMLPPDSRGRVRDDVARDLEWEPVEAVPGDVVVFDSFAPHRSDTNCTDRARRALFVTYTAAAEGDLRAAYYADKEAEMAATDGTFDGERVRVSISDDFLGRPVRAAPVAPAPAGRGPQGARGGPVAGAVAGPADVDCRIDAVGLAGVADPVARLAALFEGEHAGRLYDELVTERHHALQAAALAEAASAPPGLVAAALLHDVGHLVLGDLYRLDADLPADAGHEVAGARLLAGAFGADVWRPVVLHVAAKRYLSALEPGYPDLLTPSSVRSLAVQGGPMTPEEVAAFEADPGAADAVDLRRWDDRAKDPAAVVPPFEHWEPLLRSLVRSP